MVIHAFFGALISVIAAKLFDPLLFRGELFLPLISLAAGFVLLDFSYVGLRDRTIDRIIWALISLGVIGVLLPITLDHTNKILTGEDKFIGLEMYVFLPLFVMYCVSMTVYNWFETSFKQRSD